MPLETEPHATAAVIYLALNPVRAGLAAHPDQWPFGSHRAHACLEARPHWLASLDQLGLFACAETYRKAVGIAVDDLRRGQDLS